MAASESVDTQPKVSAGQAPPPRPKDRKRPVMRWAVHGVLFVGLTVGLFGVLPRLGGLARDTAELRHARPLFVAAAITAQAVSLASYALLYRRVLASLGARLRIALALRVTLASFLVSHVTPFGSATGTLLNVSTLETEGIAAPTTGEAIGLTSLMSTIALIALFATGLVTTAGRNLSRTYLATAGIAERAGRRAARVARHFRSSIDPEKAARTSKRLASLARSALTGRAFLASFGFASADLLFDLLSLDLMFLAFRYQPGFGPLAVAYAAANIASAIPITPAGWESSRSRWSPSPSASARHGPPRCWPCSATGSSTTGFRGCPGRRPTFASG